MATITAEGTRHIVRCLLEDGENHRVAIFQDINRQFLRYAMGFFDKAVKAKLKGEELSEDDWYFQEMVAKESDRSAASVHAGLPSKTIFNIYGAATKEIVLDAAKGNIDGLTTVLEELKAAHNPDFSLGLTTNHDVRFTTEESMLIINSLAVKRNQISAGNWAAVGNAAETPLMLTLCKLYHVPDQHFRATRGPDGKYQVDFMLMRQGVEYRCEIKLNGRGNPESVTGAIARDPRIVLADYISQQNRDKLESSKIQWVDFHEPHGYQRFGEALKAFNIESTPPDNLDQLEIILELEVIPLP